MFSAHEHATYTVGYFSPSGGPRIPCLLKHDTIDGANSWLWEWAEGSSTFDSFFTRVFLTSDGDVIAVGNAYGVLETDTASPDVADVILFRFSSSGHVLYAHQYGSAGDETVQGAAVDSLGYLYISGTTTGSIGSGYNNDVIASPDPFLLKINVTDGSLMDTWQGQYPSSTDSSARIAITNGDTIFLTFSAKASSSNEMNKMVYLIQMDIFGLVVSTIEIEAPAVEDVSDLALGASGNLYILGQVNIGNRTFFGIPGLGGTDVFVLQAAPNGTVLRSTILGSTGMDSGRRLLVDAKNGFDCSFLSLSTRGEFPGESMFGGIDAVVVHLNDQLSLQWAHQYGTSGDEVADGMTLSDDRNSLFVTGYTTGSQFSLHQGLSDATLIRFSLDRTACPLNMAHSISPSLSPTQTPGTYVFS